MIKLYHFDELRPEEILNRDIRAEKMPAKASSISSCVTCRFSMTAPSNFRA